MYAKNKIIAGLSLAFMLFGIMPNTALAAADYSTSTFRVKNYGVSATSKGTGSPSTTKSAGEQSDVFQFLGTLINSGDAGSAPVLEVTVPAGMSYVDDSLEYSNNLVDWNVFPSDDDVFDGTTAAFPSVIANGGLPGMIRFRTILNTAGTATYSTVLNIDALSKSTTINSPQARLTGGSDGDQKVVITFGNNMSDIGTTANYLLKVNAGGYTNVPTNVNQDSATQTTLTFAASTFSAGDTLSLQISGLLDEESVQIENTATNGVYQTANYTATDTVPASINSAVLFSGNTKLRLVFSENMTTGDITTANVGDGRVIIDGEGAAALGGAGLAVNWVDAVTSEITLGAGHTVGVGDTVKVSAAVHDANGNSALVSKVITLVVPVVSAPTATAQTLKSGDTSTSTVQTDTFGKIYMIKNGVAVASKAEIDAAIAAKNAFLAKDGAGAGTAYTVTIPASGSISEGAYDIIAIDSAENLSNRLSGWLTIDNTGPIVALTYSNNPTGPGSITITATFSEAVTGTPKIAIDQQGTTDLAATNMSGSGTTWTYNYTVHADNNAEYDDGVATVTISNATDVVGNANQTATNNTFTIDSTLPGVCGSANGNSTSTSPSSGLCANGSSSGVTSDGSNWVWTCTWGTAVSCSAPIATGGGGGGGGGAIVSNYTMPSSSPKDTEIELDDRGTQLPKTGDYVGMFTRDTLMVHESATHGDISVAFVQFTQVLDEESEPYTGVINPPRFLSTASTPDNSDGLSSMGGVWLGRKEGLLTFDKDFTLTIPVVEDVRDQAGSFSIFYYDESAQSYINIGGTLADDSSSISTVFNKFGKFVIFGSQSGSVGSTGTTVFDSITGFGDIVGHWGQSYIRKLYQRGVISGKTDDYFEPDAALTRAELAKIALLNFEQEVGEDESVNFPDAVQGAWYMRYINAARRLGVVAGYSDGTFRPDNQVNRAEALKMLIGAKGIDPAEYSLGDDFYDVPADAWYAPYLAYAYENGIIEGYKKTIGGGAEGLEVILSDTSGDVVTALQDALFELGFLSTVSTGTYDTATKIAVANYQLDRGIISSMSDGNAGWFTQTTLEQMQTESIGGVEREVRLFNPSNPITRAEAVKIAVALYELE